MHRQGNNSMALENREAETLESQCPQPADIRAALARILARPDFTASEHRRKFLSFIVEETLAGRAQTLKGVTIAQEVFGRDASFDSKSDPVVRLEARRLRRDLDSYYIGLGASDPVRISIPKGGYRPVFEDRRQPPGGRTEHEPIAADAEDRATDGGMPVAEPTPRGSIVKPAAMIAVVCLIAGLLLGSLWPERDRSAHQIAPEPGRPKIAVLPFQALDSSETSQLLSAGLSSELLLNLSRFDGLRLYRPPAGAEVGMVLAKLSADSGPAYFVRGEVLTEGEQASIGIELLKGTTDEMIWGNTYNVQLVPGALIDLRGDVSGRIATVLGQPYGPLTDDIGRLSEGTEPSSLDSYLCVLEAYAYRRNFSAAGFAPVLKCLEDSVRRSPDYADAWAMLGWLHLDAGRYQFVAPNKVKAEFDQALASTGRALELAPENVLALKAMSSILHHTGHYNEGERMARRALALNPHDPDTLAQVGWRLAIRGNFDEGIPLLEQAIARSVDAPGWYYHLIAMNLFMEGEYERMRSVAEISAKDGSGYSLLLIATAAAFLGDTETARTAWENVEQNWAFASDPTAFLRRHGATDQIVETMLAGFDKARRVATTGGSNG